MSTSTKHHSPTDDRLPRERFGTRAALSVVVASIATFGVLYLVFTSGDEVQHVQSIPAQPDTASQRVAAPVLPSPEFAPPAPAPAPAPEKQAYEYSIGGFKVRSNTRLDQPLYEVAEP